MGNVKPDRMNFSSAIEFKWSILVHCINIGGLCTNVQWKYRNWTAASTTQLGPWPVASQHSAAASRQRLVWIWRSATSSDELMVSPNLSTSPAASISIGSVATATTNTMARLLHSADLELLSIGGNAVWKCNYCPMQGKLSWYYTCRISEWSYEDALLGLQCNLISMLLHSSRLLLFLEI